MSVRPTSARLRSDTGAILVQVAGALVVFTMLSAFVIDYGAQLIARNEAQNAVDAAALAGATALAYDDYVDRSADGRAYTTAHAVAAKNLVAGQPAHLVIDPNVVCTSTWDGGPSGSFKRACVEVTAYRDAAHGNAIPAFIAQLMGINSFGVAAQAVAEAKDANATKCLRPIAIPDRWQEATPPWTGASTFDRWDPMNPGNPVANPDAYYSPDAREAGSGLRLTADFGTRMTLTEGTVTVPIATIKPWQYLPVEIPDSVWGTGPAALESNTTSCAAAQVAIGDRIDLVDGVVHDNALSIADGLLDLINVADPDATWNAATRRVEDSCADRLVGRCASMSPRIIALALYDPADLADQSRAGVVTTIRITNIVGFFVESVTGTDVTGYLTRHPGLHDSDAITLFDDSSFLRASLLVKK